MSTQKNNMGNNINEGRDASKRAWHIRSINWFKKIIQDFIKKIKLHIKKKEIDKAIRKFEKDMEGYDTFEDLKKLGMSPTEANDVVKNIIKYEKGAKMVYASWNVFEKYKKNEDVTEEEYENVSILLHGMYNMMEADKALDEQFSGTIKMRSRNKEDGIEYNMEYDKRFKVGDYMCKHPVYSYLRPFYKYLGIGSKIPEKELEEVMLVWSIVSNDLSTFKKSVNKVEDPNFIYDEECLVQNLFAVGHDEFVEVLMDTGKIDYDKKIVSGYGEWKTVGELIDEMSPKLSNKRMQTKIENKIHAKDKKENEPNIKEEEIMQKQLVDAYLNGNLAVFKEIVNTMKNPDFYLHEGILGERNSTVGNRTVSAMIIDSDGRYGHAEYLEALLATGKVDLGKRAYTDRNIMRDRRTVGERIENYCKYSPKNEETAKLENMLQQQKNTAKLEGAVKTTKNDLNIYNNESKSNTKKNSGKSL